MQIKTRPATPEFRDGWDRIFGGRAKESAPLQNVEDGLFGDWTLNDKAKREWDAEFAKAIARAWNEGAHA